MFGQTRGQCMGNSQYRRQHYITYHGCKYSLPSVAGFIRQSGDYYLFPPPEISGRRKYPAGKAAKGLIIKFTELVVSGEAN